MKPTNAFRTAFLLWGFVTLIIIAEVIGIYLVRGPVGFDVAIQNGSFSRLNITLSSVAVTWLLAGSLLYLLAARRVNSSNLFTIAGFYLVAFLYINFLRERPDLGDIKYYIQAAEHLHLNEHLQSTYRYPPLWATLLEPLVPLGKDPMTVIVWLANFAGLLLFYVLLNATLRRYDFSQRLAALVTTLFLLVNTPLLRTLAYMQVNLHMLNFIFLGLLLFRRRPFLSAFFMAMAVHLKASPAVLVLAFLLERDFRWMAYFGLSLVLIAIPTLALHGTGPYMDFLNSTTLLIGQRNISFRDSSFDGSLTALGELLNLDWTTVRLLVYGSKLILAGLVVWVMINIWKQRAFDSRTDSPALFNTLPPLFILMTLSAPLVWEHHGIFLSLSFLVLLKRLNTTSDWLWFGAAYFLEFLLPTFDFFPLSYGRLLAPLIILGMMWRSTRQAAETSSLLQNTARALDNVLAAK
jgi:hypothetical protein